MIHFLALNNMTTVSKLIKFKDELTETYNQLSEELDSFIDRKAINLKIVQIDNSDVTDYNDAIHDVIKQYENFIAENQKIADKLKTVIEKVEGDVAALAEKNFADITYENTFSDTDAVQFPMFNKELVNILRVRMHQYSDWRFPGLQLNVREKQYVDCMTACDPLYLTHPHIDEAKIIIKDYPEQYQNRLRLYDHTKLDQLPAGQFGFVLAWNYFEYCSMKEIKDYLEKVFSLLRPGGVLMFSYNNCDLVGSAKVAERKVMNYNSGKLLKEFCLAQGYEIICFNDVDTRNWDFPWISWAEIKRPGELNTVKAHQVLGKILPKI